MKLSDFISKYNGKFVEYHSFSSGALNQCVDLANQWITEGLGLTAIIGTNAQDFPKKKGTEFDYISNTPTGQPEPGDLMIFKSADGVGHISVHVKNISLSLFTSFDQNYPLKSPCKETNHNYTNVLGWMRAKGVTTTDTTQLESDLAEQRKQVSNLQTQVNGLLKKNEELITELQTANNTSVGYLKEIKKAKETLSTAFDCKPEWAEINAKATEAVGNGDKLDELQRMKELEAKEYKATIDGLEKEIQTLKSTTEASTAKILQLEGTIKELKYSTVTPTQPTTKWSIIDIIKSILGVR